MHCLNASGNRNDEIWDSPNASTRQHVEVCKHSLPDGSPLKCGPSTRYRIASRSSQKGPFKALTALDLTFFSPQQIDYFAFSSDYWRLYDAAEIPLPPA